MDPGEPRIYPMSQTAAPDPLDMRAILAKIDRDRAETEKLFAEAVKLRAEETKLRAEGHKFNRDLWLIPVTILGGAVGGALIRLPEILHAFGVGH
jgi:hypothetical protein